MPIPEIEKRNGGKTLAPVSGLGHWVGARVASPQEPYPPPSPKLRLAQTKSALSEKMPKLPIVSRGPSVFSHDLAKHRTNQ